MNEQSTHINRAVEVLKSGGMIIYPTDTAFGIGCRIDNQKTVDRLFEIRKRPRTQATPVLVSSVDMALAYFDNPSNIVRHLMKLHWPGALTIVAPCKTDVIHSPIRGGGNSIGLRMPNHQLALAIIEAVGVPILGPSANFHGEKTPYTMEDLDPELVKLVDFVVPGVCSLKMASTVVDATGAEVKIIRQGAIHI